MTKRWILFSAEAGAEGWEERRLQPADSFTGILAEEWDWSNGPLPENGDRVADFADLGEAGHTTHSRAGDWLVKSVEVFENAHSLMQVVVCHCHYSPIEADWQPVKRGAPISEMAPAL